MPPGTSTGDLAAVRDEPTLVLSDPVATASPDADPRALGRDQAARVWSGGWGGATRAADLRHVVLDLTLDLEAGRVFGIARSTFRAVRPETRRFSMDAIDMDIREVLDGGGFPLSWRVRDNVLEVTLDEVLPVGDEATVAVRYSAEPVRGMQSALMDGPDFAPEVFATSAPDGLGFWVPVVQTPGDLATVETILRVSDGMSAIANGILVDVADAEDPTTGQRQYRWRQEVEIPVSSIAFAAARFATFGTTAAGTELYFHLPKGADDAAAERTFGESSAVFDYFALRLGRPFPFPRYDQALVRDPIDRTLDGATLTLVASDELSLEGEELEDRRDRPRRLVARGFLRKWFGAFLAPLEERHRWILDGLAMQLELDFEARLRGDAEVAVEWEEIRARLCRRASEEILEGAVLSRVEHAERAAWALRSIRARLGEDAYWTLIQAFASGERGRVVTVEDFRRAALADLGVDLGPDLAQWSGRRSVPELEVRFQRRSVQGVGESVGIVVEQMQPGPLFRLEMPVVVHFEDGTSLEKPMLLDRKKSLMIVPIEKRVIDVAVDPEGELLASYDIEKDDAAWLAQAALSRTSIERVRALDRLSELSQSDEEARQALTTILLQSVEPSVRERCSRAMNFPGPACDLALQRAAADDASPIVRQAAMHALIQRYARGQWEPGPDETERLLALSHRETSPAVLEELDELLAIIP